jgi:Na+-driven multidrug efflux pump
MLFNSAYALIDSMMSAHFVDYGTSPITGAGELTGGTSIGIIMPLLSIFNSVALFHTVGAGLAYSRFSAKGDYVKANQCFDEAVTISFTSGLIIIAIIAVIGIPYIRFISGN